MKQPLLRFPDVINRTGLKRSSIYTRLKEGTFPKPIKIGERAIAWIESEIDAYINACIDNRTK